ncbi:hypothetical protein HOLleu_29380 [Holothuria leucospilota]|uniref:Uncharacterized protein n=1 Tax=Holothuria leucospilota TaxID=206669 RepID=A0A9Q1BN81_HOLLE|nr:hypothetical protein HOLleu_29380 [Holothuria leucospilota]
MPRKLPVKKKQKWPTSTRSFSAHVKTLARKLFHIYCRFVFLFFQSTVVSQLSTISDTIRSQITQDEDFVE